MQFDFLIIGQGISGTFVSWFLQKEGKRFLVIDNNHVTAASRIAAGIINPVTGRRMVTVWMADEILPFAWNIYNQIGHELGISAIAHKNIIDFFPNPQMQLVFVERIEQGYEYVHSYPEQNHFNGQFNYDFGCGEIRPVYTVHLETLLPAWRQQLKNQHAFLEEDFSFGQLKIDNNKIRYKDIEASAIIFCDGVSSANNSFFKQLPFAPNKGEALIVEIPGLSNNYIYKKGLLLTPLTTTHTFWIGSNYQWEFDNADPSTHFREQTEKILKDWLKMPFKILDHYAALRPATLERRPFVGIHPHHPTIAILNGMGSKGCSLAPFFAKQLANRLLYNDAITPEADVKRFSKILARQ
jgi:glycine/D-amino acid oxidase-like deaminating enzyme